jgi:hypothetical protein
MKWLALRTVAFGCATFMLCVISEITPIVESVVFVSPPLVPARQSDRLARNVGVRVGRFA